MAGQVRDAMRGQECTVNKPTREDLRNHMEERESPRLIRYGRPVEQDSAGADAFLV